MKKNALFIESHKKIVFFSCIGDKILEMQVEMAEVQFFRIKG